MAVVLSHPLTTLMIGAVGTAFFAVLTILSSRSADADDWWAPFVFIGFSLVGAALVVEALRARHELTDRGIVYRGLLRRYDLVAWTAMVSVDWNPAMQWLVVTAADGRTMRFSGLLKGLDRLATALAERAPRLEMDPVTAEMLEDARQGRLPNVWT